MAHGRIDVYTHLGSLFLVEGLQPEDEGRMNSTIVNTVAIREDRSQFLIRYRIEKERFAQILSSVTSRSVLLLGAATDENRKPGGTESPHCLIAASRFLHP
jgi:hypothetical protein